MNQNKCYYAGLDVIRGLSCIFIMLYHYTIRYNSNPLFVDMPVHWGVTLPWGCAAVTTFFLLSGFLGARHIFTSNVSIPKYLRGRFVRLFPSFAASVMLTTLVTNCFFPSAACNFKEVLLNFTMIPSLLGVRYVDGAYWTMQVEWVFYLIIACLFLFSNQENKKKILVLWLLFSIGGNIIYGLTDNSIVNKFNILIASKHSQEFLTGVAIYLLILNKEQMYSISVILLSICNQLLTQDLNHIVFYGLSCVAIYLITNFKTNVFFEKKIFIFFSWLGGISYQVYLLHQIIGFVIIYYLQSNKFYSEIYIFLPIIMSIVLGYLVQRIIEKPLLKIIK